MSAELYLTTAIEEIERKQGPLFGLDSKSTLDAPTRSHFHPELDDSKHLDENNIALHQSYIGILRWAVKLGRIVVCHVAVVLARFSAAPREGHMVAILLVFAYHKRHISSKLVFDPMKKDYIETAWPVHNREQLYPDAPKDPKPANMPPPRGRSVQVNRFDDAAHASCLLTRRLTTGLLFFLNGAPVIWYSKRQNTIESSTFGSEFVSLKISLEMNESFRYRLRMMGIPIDAPTHGGINAQLLIRELQLPVHNDSVWSQGDTTLCLVWHHGDGE